VKEKNVPVIEM